MPRDASKLPGPFLSWAQGGIQKNEKPATEVAGCKDQENFMRAYRTDFFHVAKIPAPAATAAMMHPKPTLELPYMTSPEPNKIP